MSDTAAIAGAIFNVLRSPGQYGHVGFVASHFGLPRSSLYRFCGKFTEQFGRGSGRPPKSQQQRQIEALDKQAAELTATLAGERAERQKLERFIAECPERLQFMLICLGLPAREIAEVLDTVLGVRTSHTSVLQRARVYAQKAALIMRLYFWPAAVDVDIDEIYIEGKALFVAVDPSSMAICKTRKAEAVTAENWQRFNRELPHLRRTTSDRGPAIVCAVGRRDNHIHQSDVFHCKRALSSELRKKEAAAYRAIKQEEQARKTLCKRRREGRDSRGPAQTYRAAVRKTAQVIELFDNLEQGVKMAYEALKLTRADRAVNSTSAARETIEFVDDWFRLLIGDGWAKARNGLRDPALLTYLGELEALLKDIDVDANSDQDRQYVLVTLIKAWENQAPRRWRGQPVRIPADIEQDLARRCADLPQVEEQLFAALACIHRASSAVESINSRIGLYRYSKRRFSGGFADLIALWHNLAPFREGKRKGQSPASILGLDLPTFDPYRLLASA
jgi:hypothetical protein